MDIILPGNKSQTRVWAETMINLEARKLVNTANTVGARHLGDGLTRLKFIDEIKSVINSQFELARRANSDDECMTCLRNLQAENSSLLEQSRQLQSGYAKLYAQIKYVRDEDRMVGYVISGVKVMLAGMQGALGFVLTSSMTPVGVLAGAILIVDSANTITREVGRQFLNEPDTQGMFGDGAMNIAEFMGFERSTGLAVYNGITLAGNIYSVYGLMARPGTWRLFNYISTDFYRKVDTMSRGKLTMKIVGWGVKAKVVFDLITSDDAGR